MMKLAKNYLNEKNKNNYFSQMTTNPQQFFENLMNPQKEIREKAEKELEILKGLPFTTSFPIFQSGMTSSNTNVAQLSTLLFKKTYLDNANVKAILPIEVIEQMRLFLKSLLSFSAGTEWKMLRKIADALAQLYQISDLKANFGEIIFWFNNQEPLARRFAMYIIEVLSELGELKDEIIMGSIEDLKQMFIKGLKDSDQNVKESAFRATTQFLINLKTESTLLCFTSLGDVMLEILLHLIGNNEDSDKSILESLSYLTDCHHKFWRDRIALVIEVVCAIARNKQLKSSIKELSLEIIYSISRNSPASLRKSQQFKEMIVPMMFQLLNDLDNIESNDNWEKLLTEDENDLVNMHYVIKGGFERLSVNLGGTYFMGVTQPYLTKYIESSNWVELHGAFTALALMAEGCAEVFKEHLLDLLNYISKGLIHEHLRVRYAALNALGALLRNTSPIPQKKYCANIIQGLAILMTSKEPSLKVKTQACNSLLDFLKGLLLQNDDLNENTSILLPYSTDLVKLLSSLFEMSLSLNYPPLQESSLDCISIVSNLLDKAFAPYYGQIMPGLKRLFYSLEASTTQIKTLKSHCIETISYLLKGDSQNPSIYKSDMNEIANAFAKTLEMLSDDDPQLPAILNAFTHLSLSMEEDFVPYLKFLFPLLEKFITADIGIKLENTEDKEYIPEDAIDEEIKAKIGSVEVNLGTRTVKLSVNTFALQTKILGLSVLNEMSLNMGKLFMPFTERFLMLSKDLLKFPYSRKLRKVAIRSVSSCMNCCSTDQDRGKILNFLGAEILGVFSYNITCSYFIEIKNYIKTLNECASLIEDKAVFTEAFIIQLFALLGETIKKINEKKKKIEETIAKDEGKDENDAIDQQFDFDRLNKILFSITELSGRLFKIFGESLTAQVTVNCFDAFIAIWKEGIANKKCIAKSDKEILSSVCFCDDFLEYSEISYFDRFYQTYIELSRLTITENEDILQSIIFGYGILCQRAAKKAFGNVRELIFKAIIAAIERPRNDANEKTYDNGIGALGKYVYYQTGYDENGVLLARRFLQLLPLRCDLVEGKSVALMFCRKILENHPLITNAENTQYTQQALMNIIQLNEQNHFLEEEAKQILEPAMKLDIQF